jgi:hypothetical protein
MLELLGQSPKGGRIRRGSVVRVAPRRAIKSSGVMFSMPPTTSGYRPSLLQDADAITSLRTRPGAAGRVALHTAAEAVAVDVGRPDSHVSHQRGDVVC